MVGSAGQSSVGRIAFDLTLHKRIDSRMPGGEKCSQCMNIFSMIRLPRKLPTCEHSICEPCIRDIIDNQQDIILCAFCSSTVQKQDIRIFPLNTPLLLTLSESPPKPAPQPHEEDNQLLGDLILSSQGSPEPTEDICPIHKVVLDIICISDKQRICPHCALFGAHRDHRFKRLDDFDRELKEKKRVFAEIQGDKQKALKNQLGRIGQQMRIRIDARRTDLRSKIQDEFRRYELELQKRKESAFHDVQSILLKLQNELKASGPVAKFEKLRDKLDNWEKACLSSLYKLEATKRIEDKLYYYYEGPLEIVTEGYIYIEELNKYKEEALSKINEQIASVRVTFDPGSSWFSKCVKVFRSQSQIEDPKDADECDVNPFLDCTSSEIILGTNSFLNNNTSIQVDIASIPSSKQISTIEQAVRTPKRRQSDVKALRSIQKERPRMQTQVYTPYGKKPVVRSPKTLSNRPSSEISSMNSLRSPSKLVKPGSGKEGERCNLRDQSYVETNQLREVKQCKEGQAETKQPEKIYLQFSKNTLCDFFDISECGLNSEKVVEYVHRARRIHKIRGLKICNNNLTTAGFEKMTEFLQGVSNINAANNQLTEGVFEVIVKYRQRLDSLRVLNLAHNPINLDKKSGAKLEEVKKMGVIVTL